MCILTTYTCPLCARSSTRPPTLCPDAELWGRACKLPYEERVVKATCSDECREKEDEVREWVKGKRERDEERRRGLYDEGNGAV